MQKCFKFCDVSDYMIDFSPGLGIQVQWLTVNEWCWKVSVSFQDRKHGVCLSIKPTSDLRPELTESAFSVTVYLVLALPKLPQTYQLQLSICGHQCLFLGNCRDLTKPIFVKILKKQLVLLIHTLNSYFPIFTFSFSFVIVQFNLFAWFFYYFLFVFIYVFVIVQLFVHLKILQSDICRLQWPGIQEHCFCVRKDSAQRKRRKISEFALSTHIQHWAYSSEQVHFCWYMKFKTENIEGKKIQN